ncbi:uncharacterized protein DSM5745_07500 [Aspergillus mulundensis]|uniref:AMP-dependent synthetase/ligase domain-containing protein n=1 Tax=Aspergillus mulundensis TaxID=1810919 RepID=A0A3D8REI3_9EURO|nr:hypothetical protein DSM5745_07500 [Aspergillus mulundensis]RDW72328.1 hypothetical protein DSM5745_07500 [Aspergillus mulundensis]
MASDRGGFPDDPIFAQLLHVARQIDHVIVHDPRNRIDADYAQLLTDVLRMQARMRERLPRSLFSDEHLQVLQDGSPFVAVLADGNYEFIVAAFATLSIGGAVVPLSTTISPVEAFRLLQRSQCPTILASPAHFQRGTDIQRCAASQAGAAGAGVQPTLLQIQHSTYPVHNTSSPLFDLNAAIKIPENRPGLLLFTSGTSGPPKGVVHARQLFYEIHRASAPTETFLHHRPPSWITGALPLFRHPLAGARMEIVPENPEIIWTRLREGGVTMLIGPPRFWGTLMRYFQECIAGLAGEERDAYVRGARELRTVRCGGTMPHRLLLNFWRNEIGLPLLVSYGATELGGRGLRMTGDSDFTLERCVGRPLPGVTVRLSEGDHGEIQIKNPVLFSHYLGDEQATQAAFTTDGYYRTGDLAHRVGEDYVFDGRMRLLEQPFISDACVLAVTDARSSERVAAVIRLQATGLPARGMADCQPCLRFLREQLTATGLVPEYMLPTVLRVLQDDEEIPRTASTKILRAKAAEQYFPLSASLEFPGDVELHRDMRPRNTRLLVQPQPPRQFVLHRDNPLQLCARNLPPSHPQPQRARHPRNMPVHHTQAILIHLLQRVHARQHPSRVDIQVRGAAKRLGMDAERAKVARHKAPDLLRGGVQPHQHVLLMRLQREAVQEHRREHGAEQLAAVFPQDACRFARAHGRRVPDPGDVLGECGADDDAGACARGDGLRALADNAAQGFGGGAGGAVLAHRDQRAAEGSRRLFQEVEDGAHTVSDRDGPGANRALWLARQSVREGLGVWEQLLDVGQLQLVDGDGDLVVADARVGAEDLQPFVVLAHDGHGFSGNDDEVDCRVGEVADDGVPALVPGVGAEPFDDGLLPVDARRVDAEMVPWLLVCSLLVLDAVGKLGADAVDVDGRPSPEQAHQVCSIGNGLAGGVHDLAVKGSRIDIAAPQRGPGRALVEQKTHLFVGAVGMADCHCLARKGRLNRTFVDQACCHTGQRAQLGALFGCFKTGFKIGAPASAHLAAECYAVAMSRSRQDVIFETTKRLLAQAINDGLAAASIRSRSLDSSSTERELYVQPPTPFATDCTIRLTCALSVDACVEVEQHRVAGFLRPDYLCPPLALIDKVTGNSIEEVHPGPVCQVIFLWHPGLPHEVLTGLQRELQSSVDNQQRWLEYAASSLPLTVASPLIDWERSVIWGHPCHPLHRTYLPLPPLDPVLPNHDDFNTLLEPSITFLSVPRHDLTISGPFSATLAPLLQTLNINPSSPDHIVIPALTHQLPAILPSYPAATPVKTIDGLAKAHISLRTVSLSPECNFPFHLKFSLNCQITSAIRNLHPHTVQDGPQLSSLLADLLPQNLWVFTHAACVTGTQHPPAPKSASGSESESESGRAQYLACILRHSLEGQAEEQGETLIPVAALYNSPRALSPQTGKPRCYADLLFDLNSPSKKRSWLRAYTRALFPLVLPPLAKYGIGLEAHGQNVLLRVAKATGRITGFAVRDFDGLRIHTATLQRAIPEQYRHRLDALSGVEENRRSRNFVDNEEAVRKKVYHALIQSHIGPLVYGLGLEGLNAEAEAGAEDGDDGGGGWTIVREELGRVLLSEDLSGPGTESRRREVYAFMVKETMSVKCFLQMRMQRISGDRFERELPNVLFRS